jgi:hypothetical protein
MNLLKNYRVGRIMLAIAAPLFLLNLVQTVTSDTAQVPLETGRPIDDAVPVEGENAAGAGVPMEGANAAGAGVPMEGANAAGAGMPMEGMNAAGEDVMAGMAEAGSGPPGDGMVPGEGINLAEEEREDFIREMMMEENNAAGLGKAPSGGS